MTRHRCRVAVAPLIVILAFGLVGRAASDPAVLEPQPADIVVRVVNATQGVTVPAERVLVRVSGALLDRVAEATDVDGEITFPDVEVYNFKPYIVSAWVDGVGYHTKRSGQELLDGEVAVVHAFDSTDSTEGVTVTGLNVVTRHVEGGFSYELIATLDNQARPQRTVAAAALPLRVALPAGLARTTVEVDDGPEPFSAPLEAAGEFTGVRAALPPGQARITVAGEVASGDALSFEVGCNLPVQQWSLMTWPDDLDVRGDDLREDRDRDYAGFGRWRGPALAPGERLAVTVEAAAPAVTAPVFDDAPEPTDTATPPPPREGRGFPWVTVAAAAVLLGAYAVWRFRR